MERRFRSSDWLIVIGGLMLLLASRLAWWTVEWDGGPATSTDAFDYRSTGTLPLAILLLVTVLTVVVKTDSLPLPDWLVHPIPSTAAVLTATALLGVRFFWSGFEDTGGVSRGLGLYLAAAGAVIAVLGCGVAFRGRSRPATIGGDEYADEYGDDDDPVQRFNVTMPSGEIPITRPRTPVPSRRTPPPARRTPATRQPATRRRQSRTTEAEPGGRSRRRPADPPLS